MRGLALAGMGRYEEAITAGETVIATARRIGRSDNVVMNYSTLALRDVFWLDEAATRSATVPDRLGPSELQHAVDECAGRRDLCGLAGRGHRSG